MSTDSETQSLSDDINKEASHSFLAKDLPLQKFVYGHINNDMNGESESKMLDYLHNNGTNNNAMRKVLKKGTRVPKGTNKLVEEIELKAKNHEDEKIKTNTKSPDEHFEKSKSIESDTRKEIYPGVNLSTDDKHVREIQINKHIGTRSGSSSIARNTTGSFGSKTRSTIGSFGSKTEKGKFVFDSNEKIDDFVAQILGKKMNDVSETLEKYEDDSFIDNTLTQSNEEDKETFIDDSFIENSVNDETFISDSFVENKETFIEDDDDQNETFISDSFIENSDEDEDIYIENNNDQNETFINESFIGSSEKNKETFIEDSDDNQSEYLIENDNKNNSITEEDDHDQNNNSFIEEEEFYTKVDNHNDDGNQPLIEEDIYNEENDNDNQSLIEEEDNYDNDDQSLIEEENSNDDQSLIEEDNYDNDDQSLIEEENSNDDQSLIEKENSNDDQSLIEEENYDNDDQSLIEEENSNDDQSLIEEDNYNDDDDDQSLIEEDNYNDNDDQSLINDDQSLINDEYNSSPGYNGNVSPNEYTNDDNSFTYNYKDRPLFIKENNQVDSFNINSMLKDKTFESNEEYQSDIKDNINKLDSLNVKYIPELSDKVDNSMIIMDSIQSDISVDNISKSFSNDNDLLKNSKTRNDHFVIMDSFENDLSLTSDINESLNNSEDDFSINDVVIESEETSNDQPPDSNISLTVDNTITFDNVIDEDSFHSPIIDSHVDYIHNSDKDLNMPNKLRYIPPRNSTMFNIGSAHVENYQKHDESILSINSHSKDNSLYMTEQRDKVYSRPYNIQEEVPRNVVKSENDNGIRFSSISTSENDYDYLSHNNMSYYSDTVDSLQNNNSAISITDDIDQTLLDSISTEGESSSKTKIIIKYDMNLDDELSPSYNNIGSFNSDKDYNPSYKLKMSPKGSKKTSSMDKKNMNNRRKKNRPKKVQKPIKRKKIKKQRVKTSDYHTSIMYSPYLHSYDKDKISNSSSFSRIFDNSLLESTPNMNDDDILSKKRSSSKKLSKQFKIPSTSLKFFSNYVLTEEEDDEYNNDFNGILGGNNWDELINDKPLVTIDKEDDKNVIPESIEEKAINPVFDLIDRDTLEKTLNNHERIEKYNYINKINGLVKKYKLDKIPIKAEDDLEYIKDVYNLYLSDIEKETYIKNQMDLIVRIAMGMKYVICLAGIPIDTNDDEFKIKIMSLVEKNRFHFEIIYDERQKSRSGTALLKGTSVQDVYIGIARNVLFTYMSELKSDFLKGKMDILNINNEGIFKLLEKSSVLRKLVSQLM